MSNEKEQTIWHFECAPSSVTEAQAKEAFAANAAKAEEPRVEVSKNVAPPADGKNSISKPKTE